MDTTARARLDRWMQSLLEARDPLLDGAEASIPLPGDPVRLAFALAAGGALALASGEPAMAPGRLWVALDEGELATRVAQLRRAAAEAASDGEHVVWLALGELAWTDAAGRPRRSPLALWPIELEVDDTGAHLAGASARTPRRNDALLAALRAEHGATLDVPDGALDLAALLDAADGLALDRPGWSVARGAHLALYAFGPGDVLRDLAVLDERLAASPPVAALAGAGAPPPLPAAAPDLEALAPLDADASQLAVIGAATAGASLVVQGAPGTGKTQTIANLAAVCASRGQRVLVVADRAATLDDIYARLEPTGLAEFCLRLPVGHDGCADALAALARVLDRAFRPGAGPSARDARLAELRAALDGHAAALHARGPFGMSVHEVLGRLVELRTAPCATLAESDAPGLDRVTFERRRRAVAELADASAAVEPVAAHPWRQAAPAAWPGGALERARAAIGDATRAAAHLADAVADVGALVPGLVARTADQLRALGRVAELAAATPRPGAELLTNLRGPRAEELDERIALVRAKGGGAIDVPRDPAAFVALAVRYRALAAEVPDALAGTELDAPALWAQLKRWTYSAAPLRFVALRGARAQLREVAGGALDDDAAMLAALEAVIAERACREALVAAEEPARRWFGALGGDPLALDLARVEDATAWVGELRRAFDQLTIAGGEAGRQAAWRALVAQVAASPDGAAADRADGAFARLADAVARWQPMLAELADATGIPPAELGAGPDHVASLRDQLAALAPALDALPAWARFARARRAALEAGVGEAVAAIARGDLAARDVADAWERATLLVWLRLELAARPVLARFDGNAHHARVAAFADLDRSALGLARARAIARLAERVPRTRGPELDPEVAALRRTVAAPTGALRDALAQLPTLLPRLAPCVLATPEAVVRHLDPALPAFDVVVFDDASRLAVERALPALARSRAAVIVGDSRNVRPADGADGLLDAALAAGWPMLALATHYRACHEDVFAFAGRTLYGDRVEVLPAPHGGPELGVRWLAVEGMADAAGGNAAEAEAVAREAAAQARRGRSVAVAALSRAQRELVERALAASGGGEGVPVRVDTPDRLRDASDVVLVSVGHAADALGAIAQPGGDRWLAAALTRAREQLILASSFAPEAIAADAPPGARLLADALVFARAGGGAARPAEIAPPASPITAAIARALAERGWTLRHRLSCGRFSIDLAVVDPDDPTRCVLAIEHDGAAYARAPSARVRDRVRAQHLARLGWRLHRIWSLDWWNDPEREVSRAHGAIVAAVAAGRQQRTPASRPARAARRRAFASGSAPIAPAATPAAGLAARSAAPLAGLAAPAAPPADLGVTAGTPTPGNGAVAGTPSQGIATVAPLGAAAGVPSRGTVAAAGMSPESIGAAAGTPSHGINAVAELAGGSGPVADDVATSPGRGAPPLRLPRGKIAVGPYAAACVPAGRRVPDDIFAERHRGELGKLVDQVLAAEAPIRVELLARRVGAYFGIGRVTEPVVAQIRSALDGRGRFGDEDGIVWRIDQDPAGVPPVRVAGNGPAARRDIADVPLCELAAAARLVVERANAISASELVRDCARLLGFARITEQVTERVALGVRVAAQRQLIAFDAGRATLPE